VTVTTDTSMREELSTADMIGEGSAAVAAPSDPSLDIPVTDSEEEEAAEGERDELPEVDTAPMPGEPSAPEIEVDLAPEIEAAAALVGPATAGGMSEIRGPKLTRRQLTIGAGVAAVLLVLVLLTLTGTKTGTLVITVLDASGGYVDTVDVLVDGERRCQSSPCTVEEIAEGPHVVRVSARGYAESPEEKTEVEAGAKTHLSLRLAAGQAPVAAAPKSAVEVESTVAPTEPEEAAEEEADDEDEDEAADKKKRKGKKKGRKRAADEDEEEDEPEAEDPSTSTGHGVLFVASTPSGVISVDGKVYGDSPRQISLPAGPHTVTVRHPERGTHTVSVNVLGGKTMHVNLDL
jgi:hypothetical protein